MMPTEGKLNMSDAWWEERIAKWPDAEWCKDNPVPPNLDLFDEEFCAISVTGAEGCSAQQGEANLDSRVDAENEDESESVDKDVSNPVVETRNKVGCSKSKKKRKLVDLVAEAFVTRNAILEKKNKLAEQMLEREYSYSVEHVLEILNNLPGLRKWSPFHRAAIDHLIADTSNRQGFIAFSSDEDKISYLEYRTGRSFDA